MLTEIFAEKIVLPDILPNPTYIKTKIGMDLTDQEMCNNMNMYQSLMGGKATTFQKVEDMPQMVYDI